MKELSIEKFVIFEDERPHEIFKKIEENTYGIVFVVNRQKQLLGAISDGDIRRGIISYGMQALDIKTLCNFDVFSVRENSREIDRLDSERTAREFKAIPVVGRNQEVVSILIPSGREKTKKNADFVIMAGGRGSRLMPLTSDVPKPMLILNGKPMIENILTKAIEEGFENILISVNYKKQQIIDYMGDGSQWGIQIKYIEENKPLGTAGALSLRNNYAPYVMVTNCDVITDLNYSRLLDFAIEREALASMAVYNFTTDIDFGVVDIDGFKITGFREKPKISNFINSGVYCLRAEAIKYIERDKYTDMPKLFSDIAEAGHETYAMPMFEYWLDIGRHEDLKKFKNSALK